MRLTQPEKKKILSKYVWPNTDCMTFLNGIKKKVEKNVNVGMGRTIYPNFSIKSYR